MTRADVDEYLRAIEEPKRSTLEAVRRTILEIEPDAKECLSYSMPAFKVDGKVIAGLAASSEHLSYLPHSGSVLSELADDLVGYRYSAGALRFPVDTPLPPALVAKLIAARRRELGMR
jgi:uncharacterized protein YdhG (YjbR/CyaY superfamily)